MGGIVDRRFGENDPTMTPEERILQRFTMEKQKRFRNRSIFNLEDDEKEGELTHFGQALNLKHDEIILSDEESILEARTSPGLSDQARKQLAFTGEEPHRSINEDGEFPQRQKSRAEVMKEVMTKSKLHKYERQQARELDVEETEQLDKELAGLLAIIKQEPRSKSGFGRQTLPPNAQSAETTTISRLDQSRDQIYDRQLKEMALDRRSKPTERTKTEEEKAVEEANRLRLLEDQRLRRMKGDDDADQNEDLADGAIEKSNGQILDPNDAGEFGFGPGVAETRNQQITSLEDEDDFLLESGLIASDDAEGELSDSEMGLRSEEDSVELNGVIDVDAEFIDGMETGLSHDEGGLHADNRLHADNNGIPFVYPCPQNHGELLEVIKDLPVEKIPVVIQRIRTLYSADLKSENKAKLGLFATVLVEHLVYLSNQIRERPTEVIEQVIRHIHSLTKIYPAEVSNTFRAKLRSMQETRATSPNPGDVMIFIAISTIFPTSDRFHPVVTPATLCMARYLSQKRPQSLHDLATGACIGTICLQYQSFAKRYVPELVNYVLNAIRSLSPIDIHPLVNALPVYNLDGSLRISGLLSDRVEPLRFWDLLQPRGPEVIEEKSKGSLLRSFLALLDEMAILWQSHSAFVEVLSSAIHIVRQLQNKTCRAILGSLNEVSRGFSSPQPCTDIVTSGSQRLARDFKFYLTKDVSPANRSRFTTTAHSQLRCLFQSLKNRTILPSIMIRIETVMSPTS